MCESRNPPKAEFILQRFYRWCGDVCSCYQYCGTAVANEIPSEQYLSFVLERLTGQDLTDTDLLDSLLPWSPLVKEHFKAGDTGGTEDVEALREEVQRQMKSLWQEEKAKRALTSPVARDIYE